MAEGIVKKITMPDIIFLDERERKKYYRREESTDGRKKGYVREDGAGPV